MDEEFLLMLSNLAHLHSTTPPPPPSTDILSSSTTTSSSSATPLVFSTLLSIISTTISCTQKPKPTKTRTDPSSSSSADNNNEKYSVAAFRALSTEHIWSLEAPTRDAYWRSLYGLSYPIFTTLVDKLRPHIAHSNLSLPSDYAVAMVLSRLTHGSNAKDVASRYKLEPFLVSKITNMVTRLLATKLYHEFVTIPVGRRRLVEITQAFEELTGLPNVCGAIDGSKVGLSSGSRRGGCDSVLVQVVCDHKKMFWDVCVKGVGGMDDGTHFRESSLYHRLTEGDVVWDTGVNVRGSVVRPFVVGDWCYPLMPFLMTPFSANGSGSPAQNLFDGMLMKGRSLVVDAIRLLKGRWKILQDLNVGLNHAPQTIVACCVLHNLCQIAREPEPEIEIWKEPDETGPPPRLLESEQSLYYYGENLRQVLADDLHHRLSSR